jgi:hypothetical protein
MTVHRSLLMLLLLVRQENSQLHCHHRVRKLWLLTYNVALLLGQDCKRCFHHSGFAAEGEQPGKRGGDEKLG